MKKEYVEEVASKIIEQLEQGVAPWQKPWKAGELALPFNASTGKPYRGMNSMWLAMQGHGDPRWMTYNQANDAGAQVRKGSKGTKILYWKTHDEEKATDANGMPIMGEDGKPKVIHVELERPRAFHAVVFNAEQIDGLPPLEPKNIAPEPERHARAEALLASSGATIQHVAGNRAFYRPGSDSITLPERSQFDTSDGYYATALHELGHWTGHPTRLDRDLSHPFGSEGYAREELRAEISSLMIGERMELGHDPGQHVAYVGSWIKALQEDPREIFRAAADAERITTFVMAFDKERVQEMEAASVGAAVPIGWRGEACIAFDKEMAQATGDPDYDLAQRMSSELRRYEEMTFEPSPREQEILERHREEIEEARKWIHQNVLMNPVIKDLMYETVRDFGQYTGDPEEDANRREYLAEMEAARNSGASVDLAHAADTGSRVDAATVIRHSPPENPMPERTYLAVPYAEKDEAKNAAKASGFTLQWDKENKAWFAPAGADLSRMEQWKPDAPRVQTPQAKSAEDQFADALKSAGLVVDGKPAMDGKMHRVPVEGDKAGELSGAYAGHMEGRIPGGYIENFKTGERVNWKAEGTIVQTTPEERARLAAEAAARQQKREAEQGQRQEATAAAANALWPHCPVATAENPYCKVKGIAEPVGLRTVPESVPEDVERGHNIKIAKTVREAKAMREADPEARVFKAGDLLVPGRDGEGKLWTLQSVNPDFKSFMKGGRKHGLSAFAGIGNPGSLNSLGDDGKPLIVAEGYATANTVSKLAGQPVIVAFDSGNLDAVVRELRERFPTRPVMIAADNDHEAAAKIGPDGKPRKNVGMEKATAVARAHGAGVIAPQFKPGERGSDWNDRAADKGEEETRREFAAQMSLAKRDAAINAERLTTLARERDQEARNDPTTSIDDANVAAERGKAAAVIASASEQVSDVRNAASQGVANSKGGKPALASVKASVDRKNSELQDDAKRERQDVQNHGYVSLVDNAKDANGKPQPAKDRTRPRTPRSRGIDAGM